MAKVEIRIAASTLESGRSQHLFWIKHEGDAVSRKHAVASVEAGKGTSFIASPVDGILSETVVEQGAVVEPDMVIGYVETADAL